MSTDIIESSRPTANKIPSSEVLVNVENLGKIFCRDLKRSLMYGLRDGLSDITGVPARRYSQGGMPILRKGEFWANKEISFELRRGECLGLIGRNGAGKTTLLKMLNGLIKPDSGRIEIHGRIGALIALGAGFNPILTGRENIYVNGTVLGLSKREIDEKIEDIIDFSEIREFIDAPVQSYSSGMAVRLGFSIATALSPDVLILDEVLAVGDTSFRAKCYRRISELQKSAAIIFVSHNMEQVARICSRCLVVAKGMSVMNCAPPEAIAMYDSLNVSDEPEKQGFINLSESLRSFDASVKEEDAIFTHKDLELELGVESSMEVNEVRVRIVFYSAAGERLAVAGVESSVRQKLGLSIGRNRLIVSIPKLPLKSGHYSLGVIVEKSNGDILAWSYKRLQIHVKPVNSHNQSVIQIFCNARLA